MYHKGITVSVPDEIHNTRKVSNPELENQICAKDDGDALTSYNKVMGKEALDKRLVLSVGKFG